MSRIAGAAEGVLECRHSVASSAINIIKMVTQKQVVTSFDLQHFSASRKGMSAATAGGAVCFLESSKTFTVPYASYNVPYRTRKMM